MEEHRIDWISGLPDEIIYLILSFLPFESAVETSILSSRWRSLWNKALVQHGALEDVAGAVSGFLSHFSEINPMKHPRRLQYHYDKGGVLLASVVANDKLHLDFPTAKQECPRRFGWQLQMNHQDPPHEPLLAVFFVKSLCLKSVSYLTNETVSSIISNIQPLENLKIVRCDGLRSLRIDSSPKLQKLTIFDCPDLEQLHLRSSKLRSFQYRGLLPWICPEYHFNLADAMLDFRQGPGCDTFKSSDFDPVLLTVKNASVLTLCRWTFEALIWPSLSSLQGRFRFYNLKELWWIDKTSDGYNADALLAFLKMCPGIERLFVTNDPKSYSSPKAASEMETASKTVELEQLKFVKVEGFTNEEDEISFARNISELVCQEPLIIATPGGFSLQNKKVYKVLVPWSKESKLSLKSAEEDANLPSPKHAES